MERKKGGREERKNERQKETNMKDTEVKENSIFREQQVFLFLFFQEQKGDISELWEISKKGTIFS